MNKIVARRLLVSSVLFLVVIFSVFYFVYTNNSRRQSTCNTLIPEFYCGTNNGSENTIEGKRVFNSNCAACHKLDAISTGPALRNTDSITYSKWFRKTKIDSTKIEELGIDYHRNFSNKFLTLQEVEQIFEYIK